MSNKTNYLIYALVVIIAISVGNMVLSQTRDATEILIQNCIECNASNWSKTYYVHCEGCSYNCEMVYEELCKDWGAWQ